MTRCAHFNHFADTVRPTIVADLIEHVRGLSCDLPTTVVDPLLQGVSGGKCLRGCLVYLVNEVFSGERAAAQQRATAMESIHAASLFHDDLIDQDTERRLGPATWTIIGGRKAVLLGDVILSDSLKLLAQCGRDDVSIGAGAIADMARGAYLEQTEDCDYDRVIQLKTGALFAASAELGAVSAGASRQERECARQFGALLGQAYQIADDLQELETGKGLSPDFHLVLRHFAAEVESPRTCADVDSRIQLDEARHSRLRQRVFMALRARAKMAVSAAKKFPAARSRRMLLQAVPYAIAAQCPSLGDMLDSES